MSKARKLPKDDERTKLRATREVLFEATGIDAEERSGARRSARWKGSSGRVTR